MDSSTAFQIRTIKTVRIERICRNLVLTDALKPWRIVKKPCKKTQKLLDTILHLGSDTTTPDAAEVDEVEEEEKVAVEEAIKIINNINNTNNTNNVDPDREATNRVEAITTKTTKVTTKTIKVTKTIKAVGTIKKADLEATKTTAVSKKATGKRTTTIKEVTAVAINKLTTE